MERVRNKSSFILSKEPYLQTLILHLGYVMLLDDLHTL